MCAVVAGQANVPPGSLCSHSTPLCWNEAVVSAVGDQACGVTVALLPAGRFVVTCVAIARKRVQADALDKGSLSRINGYNPGLSSAWMLQRAMSVRVNESLERDQINRMLSANFNSMAARGDAFMRPFLQVCLLPWPAYACRRRVP